jgi:undecaprenyl diphosphate synthase
MIFKVKGTNSFMDNLPKHIAIIPDGNRRWAKEKGLPTFEGHRFAAEKTLPQLIDKLLQFKIKYFTFWVLSTENLLKRSSKEIKNLFSLMEYFLKQKGNELNKKNIKIKVIGNLEKLPTNLQKEIEKIIKKTEKNTMMELILAINYGGRDEIIRAIKKIKAVETVSKENFDHYLDTAGLPPPDLIIRTGGEKRLSGFMLWQSEYSELYFTNVYFPDFNPNDLEKCIEEYKKRQRRFGV